MNAGISAASPRAAGAALSLAAMAPIGGQAAGIGKLTVKYGDEAAAVLKHADAVVPAISKSADEALAPLATGSYAELKSAGVKDAHHIIQDAAVRELPSYSRLDAPAIQLPGPSTRAGTPHYIATQVQRQAGGGTYAAERRIAYKALRQAGITPGEARSAIKMADDYFGNIGVTPRTSTRIPGNR